MNEHLNWNLLHQFANQLGEEGKDYQIHKIICSDRGSTHKKIVIEYGHKIKTNEEE